MRGTRGPDPAHAATPPSPRYDGGYRQAYPPGAWVTPHCKGRSYPCAHHPPWRGRPMLSLPRGNRHASRTACYGAASYAPPPTLGTCAPSPLSPPSAVCPRSAASDRIPHSVQAPTPHPKAHLSSSTPAHSQPREAHTASCQHSARGGHRAVEDGTRRIRAGAEG